VSETPFYRTAMGRDFYERTMPALVRELARLNALLEKLAEQRAGSPIGKDPGQEKATP
jgi:hypothetical protein